MILLDFSAIFYQNLHSSIKTCNPSKDSNNLYNTNEYINFTKYIILESIFDISRNFKRTYGDLVICLDTTSKGNWRKEVYPRYKCDRKTARDASPINFKEVFDHINQLIDELKTNSPYKVISSNNAEADDVILCLAKQYARAEKTLIVSADKDLIQAQEYGDVQQYSPMLRDFITFKTKNCSSNDEWLMEHVVLGDTVDNVPKIVDETEFTDDFKKFIDEMNLNLSPLDIAKNPKLLDDVKFDGQIFSKKRFGVKTLEKTIKQFGSLENWINSDELLKYNFERNKQLVLAEYIPQDVFLDVITKFKSAETKYVYKDFLKYINENHLSNLLTVLPNEMLSNDIIFDF